MEISIVGAGAAGLATAAALSGQGHRLRVFERDAPPEERALVSDPGGPERWSRPGVPQMRHSHAFLARLRSLLAQREPKLLAALLDAGARELHFAELARPWFGELDPDPSDSELALLACRRTTFEWVLRRYVESLPDIEIRSRTSIEGLAVDGSSGTRPPHVCALLARDHGGSGRPERIASDLVIDASGRRTAAASWLRAAGAPPFACEREPCGIFYASRFYRFRDGIEPLPIAGGVLAIDLGYLKVGLFPGDGRSFSLTLAASPDDRPLTALLREPGFEAAARAIPVAAPYVSPEIAEPISRLHGMGDLESVRHFPHDADGEPLVTGLVAVGDALIHTNPLYGRGCTLSFIHAYALADALAAESANSTGPTGQTDLVAFAHALDRAVESEIVPWYESSLGQDRDARAVADELARGGDPYRAQGEDGRVEPRAYMRSLVRDGLAPAMREDVGLLRAFLRVFNLLEAPRDLMKDPTVFQRVLAFHASRSQREPFVQGPDRATMVACIEHAEASVRP